MNRKVALPLVAAGVLVLLLAVLALPALAQGGLTPTEELGKDLFFDQNLSLNNNQACAACHDPAVGYTGSDPVINAGGSVYEGSIPGAFGDRKPPAAAYAGDSPILNFVDGQWIGGMFWDGRATGATLGDPLAEQAKGPFLNPKEQALPDAAALCAKVSASSYAGLFEEVWGVGSLDCGAANVAAVYNNIGRSIAAYERSKEVSSFTSKYDLWLAGKARLTGQEMRGMALFEGKAKCANCHPGPLFTDFTYDNLGMPKNPMNPATIADPSFADPGLGGYLKNSGATEAVYMAEWGKFKVPTLRNVDKRPTPTTIKDYGHNGYFKSLEEIVHFYNTRDVATAGWPAPEVSQNLNTEEVGNLGLNPAEESALVAFLKTLSDGFTRGRR